jgi:peptidoglycan/LPS O-acetylase OafA/YrhL
MLPFLCQSTFFTDKFFNKLFIKVITWLSLLSYPMYLIHMEVQRYFKILFPYIYSDLRFVDVIINTIVTIFISYIIYELIHEPMIKLRAYVVKRM